MRFVLFGLATLALASPVAAQQQRTLAVPADKGWQHAETGLILTARIDGLARTDLVDSTAVERDVAASFDNADRTVIASIYIFHPAIPSVPMWFDRVETAIRSRDLFGGATPAMAAPMAFVPPTGGAASGLRQVYATGKGPFRATGAAVMPLGSWLVAIRMSAKTLDPAALDAAMSRVIAGLRWPAAGVAPSRVAVPVAACTTPLPAAKAKLVKRNGANTLMDSLMSVVASREAPQPARPAAPVTWCRDAAGVPDYGVYRSADGAGYVVALGDAGRSITVIPSIDTQIDRSSQSRIAVLLTDVDDTTTTFDSFDRLPLPRQVVDLVGRGAAQSRLSQDGKTVNISLPSH